MSLSWNEIKTRAISFSKEWENESSEDAEAKSFWDGFFNVFGVSRRRVASFEKIVRKQDGKQGYIDLLWKGVILVEHKSRGRNLDKAFQQAKDYFHGLKEHELPKFILVSDFQFFRLYDLDNDTTTQFALKDLVKYVNLFGFIAGHETRIYKEQDPVNIQAAERMGKLHDALEASGYTGHALEVYLVRLLFCLFAEDTSIFERTQFQYYIDQNTKEDGSDLAMHLAQLFQVLNTPKEKRLKTLDESLDAFPYVNGKLFEEMLPLAAFDSKMREMLLSACALDWSKISPAIFGSMFQAVMNPKERRNLGAHYTSEKNIQKVIRPLFLDDLYKEFEKRKTARALLDFQEEIAKLRFLDPACGCGNFLIIAYRELRELELNILRELRKINEKVYGMRFLNIGDILKVKIDQFYGIEYDEFPARIAEVAMYLIDHQMNLKVQLEFGQYFNTLPLKKSATIVCGNSLQLDWNSLLNAAKTIDIEAKEAEIIVRSIEEPAEKYGKVRLIVEEYKIVDEFEETKYANPRFDYIFGNPPFIGKKEQNKAQKADMERVFVKVNSYGVLDYVTAWYLKAAKFIQGTNIKCAFVSTNSIAQGEQVGILWNEMYNKYKIKIHFAHRTFSWRNEAKGNAAVHCVIIGFGTKDIDDKYIFDYPDIKGEPTQRKVKNINPYLSEGSDLVILKRGKPIVLIQEMNYGSMPIDNGILILSDEEKVKLLEKEPSAEKYIKRYTGGNEFINNITRWCLWFIDVLQPDELRRMPLVMDRIKQLKKYRQSSERVTTVKLAETPHLFGEIRQPKTDYIIVPKVSSANRKFIPIGINSKDIIASGSCLIVPNANLFIFGILTSTIHMTWIKYTCGRMRSDYQYSASIVYNNYPFPQNVSEAQKKKVEVAAQKVLDARAAYPTSSLADLYDPLVMPPALVKAHQALDKAVDLCYRPQVFTNELSRIEYLFGLYEAYTAPMFKTEKRKKKS